LTFTPTKTYFRKLVWDVTDESPVSMVYRYATTSPCLVTTHRKHVRSHKIHYATFERIMLEFLSAADWKAIAREGTNIPADLLTKQESLAKEIDDTEKVLHRYEAIVDDPDSDQFERIHAKFKATLTKSKRLAEERTALEAQIAAQDRAGKLIIETEGIDIYPVDRNTKEGRLKLRSYLAQRIERIDITFGARIFTAGPVKDNPIKGLEAGEGKIVARLKFVNGAVKWAIIDKNRAVLLW
jgi:hypothetical protein